MCVCVRVCGGGAAKRAAGACVSGFFWGGGGGQGAPLLAFDIPPEAAVTADAVERYKERQVCGWVGVCMFWGGVCGVEQCKEPQVEAGLVVGCSFV